MSKNVSIIDCYQELKNDVGCLVLKKNIPEIKVFIKDESIILEKDQNTLTRLIKLIISG